MGSIIPLLTEYEKEHISERQALPEQYLGLSDAETGCSHCGSTCHARATAWSSSVITISATRSSSSPTTRAIRSASPARSRAGPRLTTSCSAVCTSWPRAPTCSRAPHQQVILPDLAAGCSMADMVDPDQLQMCWEELTEMGIRGRRPGDLHQLRGLDKVVRRRARRHRLHVVERRRDVEVGVRTRREGALPARPAPGPQHRLHDGDRARRDGRVGSERDFRWPRSRSGARARR